MHQACLVHFRKSPHPVFLEEYRVRRPCFSLRWQNVIHSQEFASGKDSGGSLGMHTLCGTGISPVFWVVMIERKKIKRVPSYYIPFY